MGESKSSLVQALSTIYIYVSCSLSLYGFCVVPVWVPRSAYDHWPSGMGSSSGSQLVSVSYLKRGKKRGMGLDLHFALDHLVDELVLALCNLDHLLDQTGANLALQIRDAVLVISIFSPLIGCSYSRLDCVLRLGRKDCWGEGALRLVVCVALHGLDVLGALLLAPDALGEALGNLAIPLGLAVLAVVDVLGLGQHNGNACVVGDGVEVLWVLGDLAENLLLPAVPALGLALFDDAQAVARQGLGRLAVHGGLGDLLELGEGARVVVEECGARRGVGDEACEAGRGAGLEELAGLDGGEESGSGPHGCGVVAGRCVAQWVRVVMLCMIQVQLLHRLGTQLRELVWLDGWRADDQGHASSATVASPLHTT